MAYLDDKEAAKGFEGSKADPIRLCGSRWVREASDTGRTITRSILKKSTGKRSCKR